MGTQTFTTSGSWQAPTGVTSVTVECWAGGGGGGAAQGNPSTGGGGAGGCYVKKEVTVVPLDTYTVTVGVGGTATTSAGNVGGDSWFSTAGTVIAKGGAGGSNGVTNNSNGAGGAGSSTGCIGDVGFIFRGGNGGTGAVATPISGGGGGGAGSTGDGGDTTNGTAGTGTANGGGDGGAGVAVANTRNAGAVAGGGGSGAYASGAADRAGGAGGDGKVILTWADPVLNVTTADDLNAWQDTHGLIVGIPKEFVEDLNNLADAHTKVLEIRLSFADDANLLIDYFTYAKRPRWQDAESHTVEEVSPNLTKTFADDLNSPWQDNYSQILEYRLSFAEDLNNLADSYSQVTGQLVPISDNLNAWLDYFAHGRRPRWQDSVSSSLSSGPDLSQSLSDDLNAWQDALELDLQSAAFTKIVSDDLNNWQDAYSQVLEYQLNFSEQLTQSDSLGIGYGFLLTDAANTLNETVNINEGLLVPFSDSFSLSDAYSQIEGQLIGFSDDVNNLADGPGFIAGQLTSFADSFSLSDGYDLQEEYLVGCEDQISLSDFVFLNFHYILALGDDVNLLNDAVTFSGGELDFTDALSLSDDIRVVLGLVLMVSDNANNFNDVILYFIPRAGWTVTVRREVRSVKVEP